MYQSGAENRQALILKRFHMKGIKIAFGIIKVPAILILLLFSGIGSLSAQQNFYDTDQLPPSFHQQRRELLRKKLGPSTCAVIFANPTRNRSNDVDFQYSQDPDFYYLTGLLEPNSVLFIFSEPVSFNGAMIDELIYVQDRDLKKEVWNGRRLGVEGVKEKLQFKTVVSGKQWKDSPPPIESFTKVLVKYPTDIREKSGTSGSLNTMVYYLKETLQDAGKEFAAGSLMNALASLRQIKTPEEMVLMQKAVDITLQGLSEAIKACKPGMTEYQAQAIVEFYFKHKGSEYPGYGSISGSGINSCVLHYVTNRKVLESNDMLLMDMGAEYHGYTADVTRTIPVDGTFSEEQKAIYNLVLEAQLAGIEKAVKGNKFNDPNQTAKDIIAKGLVKLGIISKPEQSGVYFNHGTSHYLGLEVHDPGLYGPLEPGMVITVEPGIYIPEGSACDKKWWNIGVRIEDDVLITDNQPFVMSDALPKTIEALEELMQQPTLFDQIK
jgi:Xaa-Pro aminopeptidase